MDFASDGEVVELGECDNEQEMLVVRSLLDAEGVACSGPMLTTGGVSRYCPGGLKLYVRKEDLEGARAILDAAVEVPPDASDDAEL
jgi:hypothetical protein